MARAIEGRDVADERILIVVPARIGSERLPNKPLYRLAGRPLVEWVWRRVKGFATPAVAVIATDAEQVVQACRSFGAEVVLTSPEHASGTDRVAEVAQRPEYREHDIIVNVQGDEPFIEESHVVGAVEQVTLGRDIGTVATPVRDIGAWRDPAVVKVARRRDGAALYFTRAPVPHRRAGVPDERALSTPLYLRHIGVYAYRRRALLEWAALSESELEREERLEQLRPMESGMSIGVSLVERAGFGVDTEADALRAEERLAASHEGTVDDGGRRTGTNQLERSVNETR